MVINAWKKKKQYEGLETDAAVGIISDGAHRETSLARRAEIIFELNLPITLIFKMVKSGDALVRD